MDFMDICYGPNTSIYDVLEVSQDASLKEIQAAFIARRLELYQTMQSTGADKKRAVNGMNGEKHLIAEKDFIEKKINVVAAAFKVLRDPRQKRKYDSKLKRTSVSKSKKGPSGGNSSPTTIVDTPNLNESLTNDLDQVLLTESDDDLDDPVDEFTTPRKKEKKSSRKSEDTSKSTKSKKKNVKDTTVPVKTQTLEEREDYEDDESIHDFYSDVLVSRETGLGSWLRRNKYRDQADTVDTVATEIKGSVADICLSFSQIMTAFSIDESAIDAMAKNIGDTSQQLSGRRYK